MADDISSKVKKIVADHLGIDEAEFGSEISDSEAEKILTVGDAIKFIESKNK